MFGRLSSPKTNEYTDALQWTAAGHRGCSRRASRPPSLSVGLAVLGIGGSLTAVPEVRADRLAWYVSISALLLTSWFLFLILVERAVFFQYRMPA